MPLIHPNSLVILGNSSYLRKRNPGLASSAMAWTEMLFTVCLCIRTDEKSGAYGLVILLQNETVEGSSGCQLTTPKACMKWTFSRPPTAITEVFSLALCSVSSRDHVQSSAWSKHWPQGSHLGRREGMRWEEGIMVSSANFKSVHLKPHFSPAPQLLGLSLFKYSYKTAGPPPRHAGSREKRPHFHCLSLLSILLSRTFWMTCLLVPSTFQSLCSVSSVISFPVVFNSVLCISEGLRLGEASEWRELCHLNCSPRLTVILKTYMFPVKLPHDQYHVSIKHWTGQPRRLHKDAALKRTKRPVYPILTSKVTRR